MPLDPLHLILHCHQVRINTLSGGIKEIIKKERYADLQNVLQLSLGATLLDHGASTIFQSHQAQSQIYALHFCTGYQQCVTMTWLDRQFYPKENGKFSSISSLHWMDVWLTQHIDSELPKVLIKVLFWAHFWGKELFCALFLVLLKVPELFWALFKALYFALFWNTFLEHFFKH